MDRTDKIVWGCVIVLLAFFVSAALGVFNKAHAEGFKLSPEQTRPYAQKCMVKLFTDGYREDTSSIFYREKIKLDRKRYKGSMYFFNGLSVGSKKNEIASFQLKIVGKPTKDIFGYDNTFEEYYNCWVDRDYGSIMVVIKSNEEKFNKSINK